MNMIGPHLKGIVADYDDLASSPDFVDIFAADDGDVEVISEDILAMEILARLVDSRTALRCCAVSKRWHSLISAPEFLPNFLRHHRRPPSYMFVEFRFRRTEKEAFTNQWCESNLIAEEGPNLTVGATSDHNFPGGLTFDSACDDFFLLSAMIDGKRRLYIRNAVSGQCFPLPDIPLKKQSGFAALVSHPDSTPSHYNYRVVYFTSIFRYGGRPVEYYTIIFSPETGTWSDPVDSPLTTVPEKPDVVAANGLLYWIDTGSRSLAIFDAFGGSWRFVVLPANPVMSGELFSAALPVAFCSLLDFNLRGLPHIGGVLGRVRISQLFKIRGGRCFYFYLMIWELNEDHATWRLASEGLLRNHPGAAAVGGWLYFFSFHPGDSDVVFLSCGCDVYSYHLSRWEYERVFTLETPKGGRKLSITKELLARCAHILTAKLPPWPTKLPALSSFHV